MEHLFANQHQLANDTSDLFQQLASLANITTRRIDTVWKELEAQAESVSHTYAKIAELKDQISTDLANLELANQYLHDWSNYHLTHQDRSLLL